MVPRKPQKLERRFSRSSLALLTLWIVLQASAAYLLAEQVSPFFYQQF